MILKNANFKAISVEYLTLAEEKDKCQACKIYNHYKCVVPSEGNAKNPTFMFVGESPGRVEVDERRPFIGPAGQLLREYLRQFGFNKKNTILTNVIPCRPENNKFPTDVTIVNDCVFRWLYKEIEILRPKFIITCGSPALKAIRRSQGVSMSVGANRGRWDFVNRFRAFTLATWHPSYVLRCQNDENKQTVLIEFKNDLEKVSKEWLYLYSDKRLYMSLKEQKKHTIKKVTAAMSGNVSEFLGGDLW